MNDLEQTKELGQYEPVMFISGKDSLDAFLSLYEDWMEYYMREHHIYRDARPVDMEFMKILLQLKEQLYRLWFMVRRSKESHSHAVSFTVFSTEEILIITKGIANLITKIQVREDMRNKFYTSDLFTWKRIENTESNVYRSEMLKFRFVRSLHNVTLGVPKYAPVEDTLYQVFHPSEDGIDIPISQKRAFIRDFLKLQNPTMYNDISDWFIIEMEVIVDLMHHIISEDATYVPYTNMHSIDESQYLPIVVTTPTTEFLEHVGMLLATQYGYKRE